MKPYFHRILFVLSLVVFAGVGRLCIRKTEGFTCLKVQDNFSEQLTCSFPQSFLSDEIKTILKQDFRYYKRGAQSFVFLSSDGNYVLKIFNNRLKKQRALFHTLPFSYAKKKEIEAKLQTTFNSYCIAATKLHQETGVLFAHLAPDPKIDLSITVVDKLGIKHVISSQKSGFLLQKKSELIYSSLKRNMKDGRIEKVHQMIDSLIDLVSTCHAKGVVNEDPSIRKNFGLQGNQCIVLDVGRLLRDDALSDPSHAREQKKHHFSRFRKYLKKNYPELLDYFDKRIAA